MTADLRQAIEMLQLTAMDVQALIRQELADNPCLELADEHSGQDQDLGTDGREAEGDWEDTDWNDGTREADSWSDLAVGDGGMDGPVGMTSGGNGEGNWEAMASKATSLPEHLRTQLEHQVADAKLRMVGRYLIDALDEDGYLRADLAEVARRLGVTEEVVDDARALIQMLEPVGVGARTLAECLRLQLHARGKLTAVADVCLLNLDKVAARDWSGLVRAAKGLKIETDINTVVDAVEALRGCNPKPGLSFGASKVDTVVPDVVVVPDGDGWRVELNGAAFPKLLAQPLAFGASGRGAEQAKKYASENFGKAKWLIGALEQRAGNILKVARAIISAQGQFLAAGQEYLVPLTMRQVAERVGVHESTVSRVSRGKFLQTPRGVFEFTHFFASGIGTTGGQVSVASGSVQAMIARLVKAESPSKPLSDEQIVLRLKDEGIDIARRTVAKYRGILGIPGTSERRVR